MLSTAKTHFFVKSRYRSIFFSLKKKNLHYDQRKYRLSYFSSVLGSSVQSSFQYKRFTFTFRAIFISLDILYLFCEVLPRLLNLLTFLCTVKGYKLLQKYLFQRFKEQLRMLIFNFLYADFWSNQIYLQ